MFGPQGEYPEGLMDLHRKSLQPDLFWQLADGEGSTFYKNLTKVDVSKLAARLEQEKGEGEPPLLWTSDGQQSNAFFEGRKDNQLHFKPGRTYSVRSNVFFVDICIVREDTCAMASLCLLPIKSLATLILAAWLCLLKVYTTSSSFLAAMMVMRVSSSLGGSSGRMISCRSWKGSLVKASSLTSCVCSLQGNS